MKLAAVVWYENGAQYFMLFHHLIPTLQEPVKINSVFNFKQLTWAAELNFPGLMERGRKYIYHVVYINVKGFGDMFCQETGRIRKYPSERRVTTPAHVLHLR